MSSRFRSARPRDLSLKRDPQFLELEDAIWQLIEEESDRAWHGGGNMTTETTLAPRKLKAESSGRPRRTSISSTRALSLAARRSWSSSASGRRSGRARVDFAAVLQRPVGDRQAVRDIADAGESAGRPGVSAARILPSASAWRSSAALCWASLIGWYRRLRMVARSVPERALRDAARRDVPLIIIWFGIGMWSKVFIVFHFRVFSDSDEHGRRHPGHWIAICCAPRAPSAHPTGRFSRRWRFPASVPFILTGVRQGVASD